MIKKKFKDQIGWSDTSSSIQNVHLLTDVNAMMIEMYTYS